MCHGQTIAAGTRRVGCITVNSTHAACREDGHVGQVAVNGTGFAVKSKRAVTDQRIICEQRVAGMMGKSDQVDRSHIGQDGNVRTALHGSDQSGDDSLAGTVTHMQDTPPGMGRLFSVFRLAIRLAVELDPGFLYKYFL